VQGRSLLPKGRGLRDRSLLGTEVWLKSPIGEVRPGTRADHDLLMQTLRSLRSQIAMSNVGVSRYGPFRGPRSLAVARRRSIAAPRRSISAISSNAAANTASTGKTRHAATTIAVPGWRSATRAIPRGAADASRRTDQTARQKSDLGPAGYAPPGCRR
jgi:hypothetical protein